MIEKLVNSEKFTIVTRCVMRHVAVINRATRHETRCTYNHDSKEVYIDLNVKNIVTLPMY